VRLNKYLARAGAGARRACDRLIAEGRVTVNGAVAEGPWLEVDPERDRIEVGGRTVHLRAEPIHILLHKPAGVLSTAHDPFGRPTVLDLVRGAASGHRLYPVGRLDGDTTGALLLTDDGELAFRLTHPRYGIEKVYRVEVAGTLSEADLSRIATGLELEDGPARPDACRRLGPHRLELVLHEGRKRIVKRLLAAVGYRVTALHRSGLAGLTSDGLAPGAWRPLTEEEVGDLRARVGLTPAGKKEMKEEKEREGSR
jgi:23S rRNA pseudouridine2605 synthase